MTAASHWPRFLEAVAVKDQPAAVFAALAEIVEATVGTKLFTASVYEQDTQRSRRVYSQNEAAYPVGGFKPIPPGKWSDTVLRDRKIYATTRIEEVAEIFFDWELIRSLGCESSLNLPIVVAGEVAGTVNLLHEAGYYTPERVARVEALRPFATIAFLVAHRPAAGAGPA